MSSSPVLGLNDTPKPKKILLFTGFPGYVRFRAGARTRGSRRSARRRRGRARAARPRACRRPSRCSCKSVRVGHRADQFGPLPCARAAAAARCRARRTRAEKRSRWRAVSCRIDGRFEAAGGALHRELGLGRRHPLRYPTESTISRERLGNWARNSARSVFEPRHPAAAYSSERPGRRIQQPRLQDVDVLGVDTGHPRRHLVAEVGVGLPLDGALGDRLRRSPTSAGCAPSCEPSRRCRAADPCRCSCRYTSIGLRSSSSRKRLPCSCRGASGRTGSSPARAGTCPPRRLPPAAVPVVSPSMKNAAACGPSSLATAGITFSLRFSTSRKSAVSIVGRVGGLDVAEREHRPAVLGVALVEEVDLAVGGHASNVLEVGAGRLVTAPWMVGSSSG